VKNLLAAVVFLGCTSFATAGPVYSVKLDSLGAGADVTLQLVEVGHSGLQSFDAFAGVFNMTLNGKSFTSFCIDTAHEVSVGQTYSVQQKAVESGLTYGPQMEYLYAKYIGTAVHNNTEAAALQIALWDLVNGGQSLLTGTTFRYTDTKSPIYTEAVNFIAEAKAYTPPGSGSVGDWEDASASGNALGRGQSLIGPWLPGLNTNTLVPAPPAGVLAASAFLTFGTLGIGRLTRRRLVAAA
jgi:hypothetical protein